MSSADRAAELRAQAEALDAMAGLEEDLLAAKQAYAEDSSPERRQAKQAAAEALRAARQEARENEATTVGGDAFVSNGSGG